MFRHGIQRLTRGGASAVRRFSTKEAPKAAAAASSGSPGLVALALVAAFVYTTPSSNNNNNNNNKVLEEQSKVLTEKISDLQVQLSGKTNSAFVFIKPHACKSKTPEKVESLVESSFAKHGIRITGKGSMAAETIDKNMHIDTHYGAIASKAVKLQPKELNVPDKGKAAFEKMFGESWDSAVAAGKVYNAKDGATKLGVDGAGVDAKWSKLSRGKDLIKFGGGFYCGKLEEDVYVMNGFYMQMRAAYTNPGEKIVWYTVSWPTDSLSWSDFRSTVLGATDPTTAPVGSVRRSILDQYKELGLATKPNTGDNGVHASASPFEAMAERVNWLGVSPTEDSFAKGMLSTNAVTPQTIALWSGDEQVTVDGETEPGKKMSVFDTLEDLDADQVLAKLSKIH